MKKVLNLISTGPGDIELLTLKAKKLIDKCDVIVGYGKYLNDLAPIIKDKETYQSSMTEEIKRCHKAIDFALMGKKVALISNGDVNIFGLGSLVVELIDKRKLWDEIELNTTPGIASFLEASARIGAPIGQDFAVVSLSDRLVPIELIESRIEAALNCDFILTILNPKSRTRTKPYEMLLNHLNKEEYKNYPIIIAQNVSRENEKVEVSNVSELIQRGLENTSIHMSSLIIIGNKSSRLTENKKMITPRGYLDKYTIDGGDKK